MTPRKARLERLAEKYRVLAELRKRREEMESQGRAGFSEEESAVRSRAFRQVAREFPGALRELEHSTWADLRGRLQAVERQIRCRGREPEAGPGEWMDVVMEYHDLLREALAVKLWLAGAVGRREPTTEPLLVRFHRWHRRHPARHTPTRDFDRARLDLYRRPPGGRLHAIVWKLLEERFGRGRGELERTVFRPRTDPGPAGPPPR